LVGIRFDHGSAPLVAARLSPIDHFEIVQSLLQASLDVVSHDFIGEASRTREVPACKDGFLAPGEMSLTSGVFAKCDERDSGRCGMDRAVVAENPCPRESVAPTETGSTADKDGFESGRPSPALLGFV
jgi:hypothetical protein